MKEIELCRVQQFNRLWKELDDLYHDIALESGISDSILTILYTVCRMDGRCTQRDVCAMAYVSKQTVNSAIKKLESSGHIYLEQGKGRDKYICLTEKGEALAAKSAWPLIRTEDGAFSMLTEEEQRQFLFLTEKYVNCFSRQKSEGSGTNSGKTSGESGEKDERRTGEQRKDGRGESSAKKASPAKEEDLW